MELKLEVMSLHSFPEILLSYKKFTSLVIQSTLTLFVKKSGFINVTRATT